MSNVGSRTPWQEAGNSRMRLRNREQAPGKGKTGAKIWKPEAGSKEPGSERRKWKPEITCRGHQNQANVMERETNVHESIQTLSTRSLAQAYQWRGPTEAKIKIIIYLFQGPEASSWPWELKQKASQSNEKTSSDQSELIETTDHDVVFIYNLRNPSRLASRADGCEITGGWLAVWPVRVVDARLIYCKNICSELRNKSCKCLMCWSKFIHAWEFPNIEKYWCSA